tara:strand:+ start:833 stop:1510 length:678 start_codon:yes stop_codon:yes gene_type:complete
MKVFYPIIIGVLLFLSACEGSDDSISPDFGYEYSPLEVGNYVIYQIDSIHYDDFANTVDTFSYQLKEVIDSSYTLLDGQEGYRLERFRRNNASSNWRIIDVWVVYRTKNQFIRIEENQPIVKLVFPVKTEVQWDINSRNTSESTLAEITSIQSNSTIRGLALNETATVTIIDDRNLIERKLDQERYSKEVGLVSRYFKDLRTQVTGQIVRGIDYRKELIEFGEEN